MDWLQFETHSAIVEPQVVEDLLTELGASAIWLQDAGDDPVLEPGPGETPLWPATSITGLFPATASESAIRTALETKIPGVEWRVRSVAEQDWQAAWQQSLDPISIGGKLWILPSKAPKPTNRTWLELEPGLAFGTGQHPSTALCLEWLTNQKLSGASVLDFGCGSGVLAIAALKLGARHAVAIDLDPQALTATRNNALKNSCATQIDVKAPADIDSNKQYDLLLANILSGTLIEQRGMLSSLLKPGAHLALAGILKPQAQAVIDAWSPWAKLYTSQAQGDWVLVTGHRNGK